MPDAAARRRAARQHQPHARAANSNVASGTIDRDGTASVIACLPAAVRLHRLGVLRLVVDAQQLLLVEDHLLAAPAGQVVEARQLDGVDRAGLFAHAAEDAAQLVDGEALGIFFAVGPGAFDADDVDAMGRAGRGTEETGHALHPALLVLVQAMHAAIDQRIADLRPLLGKADRHLAAEQVLASWSSAPGRTAASTSCRPGPACGSSIHLMFGSSAFMVSLRLSASSRVSGSNVGRLQRSQPRPIVGVQRRESCRPRSRPAIATAHTDADQQPRLGRQTLSSSRRADIRPRTPRPPGSPAPAAASPSRPGPSTGRSGTAASSSGPA